MPVRWVLIALLLHAAGAVAFIRAAQPRTTTPISNPPQVIQVQPPARVVQAALERTADAAPRERSAILARSDPAASVARPSSSTAQAARVHQGSDAGAELPEPAARPSKPATASLHSAAIQSEPTAPRAQPVTPASQPSTNTPSDPGLALVGWAAPASASASAPASASASGPVSMPAALHASTGAMAGGNPAGGPVSAAAPQRATPTQGPRIDASWQGNTPPPYPSTARRQGLQGTVKLDLLIEADGSVAQIRMRESSGSPLLDRSALTAVRQWRFIPAHHEGQSVAAWYSAWEWVFRLQEGS